MADNLRAAYNSGLSKREQLGRKAFKEAMAMPGFQSEKASRGPTKNMMTYFGHEHPSPRSKKGI